MGWMSFEIWFDKSMWRWKPCGQFDKNKYGSLLLLEWLCFKFSIER